MLVFDRVIISASYTFPSASSGKHLDFGFDALIVLNPRGDNPMYSASFEIDIEYDDGTWTLEGIVSDLNVACLYSLFPGTDNDQIMNVMEEITIFELDVTYTYTTPQATSITALGILQLGPVTLEIDYSRGVKGLNDWSFSAALGIDFDGGQMLIGDFLSGACAELATLLPDFVYNTTFVIPDQTGRDDNTTPPMRLMCEKYENFFVLSIIVEAHGLDFYYVQLTDSAPNQGVKKPKRMLRFEMESLPILDSIPLLDTFTQPFDQMDLMWVSDDFTKGEIEFLNTDVFQNVNEKLTCKPAVTPNPDPTKQNDDIVLAQGMTFRLSEPSNTFRCPFYGDR